MIALLSHFSDYIRIVGEFNIRQGMIVHEEWMLGAMELVLGRKRGFHILRDILSFLKHRAENINTENEGSLSWSNSGNLKSIMLNISNPKWISQPLHKTNNCFRVSYPCLTLCFCVGTWEDNTKHSASFSSFETSLYCIFWQIVLVHMLLCCFQVTVMSATTSSSEDCTGCHNNTVEHCIWL